MKYPLPKLAPISLFLLSAVGVQAQTAPVAPPWSGDIVYQSTFNLTSYGPYSIGASGWGVYSGDTATYSTANTGAGQTAGLPGSGGGYINVGTEAEPDWLYAGPTIPGATQTGIIQTSVQSGSTAIRLMADQATLALDLSSAQYQVSFDSVMSSTQSVVNLFVALRVGENWYVSTTGFNPEPVGDRNNFSSGTYENYHNVLDLTANADSWQSLTLVADETMALGSVAGSDLDLSDVTGIGIYITKKNTWGGYLRLDSMVITQVPEPAATASLLAAATLLTVMLLRRRR